MCPVACLDRWAYRDRARVVPTPVALLGSDQYLRRRHEYLRLRHRKGRHTRRRRRRPLTWVKSRKGDASSTPDAITTTSTTATAKMAACEYQGNCGGVCVQVFWQCVFLSTSHPSVLCSQAKPLQPYNQATDNHTFEARSCTAPKNRIHRTILGFQIGS